MDLKEAIIKRNSVRSYIEKPIDKDAVLILNKEIDKINKENGLNVQLVLDEPKAFNSTLAHYGKFSGVTNYIALIGKKGKELDEKCGFYGEKLVLLAQTLGLNTCWVGLTFKKIPDVFKVEKGEKLCLVIALGYGKTQGARHKSKKLSEVAIFNNNAPDWFISGVESALLAPTAINQQKFKFQLVGDKVKATSGLGFFSKVDLGIAKLHFLIGSDKDETVFL